MGGGVGVVVAQGTVVAAGVVGLLVGGEGGEAVLQVGVAGWVARVLLFFGGALAAAGHLLGLVGVLVGG